MRLDGEQLRALATSLRGPGGRLDPPMAFIQAVAAAVGSSDILCDAVTMVRGDTGAESTSWRYGALTSAGLVAGEVTADIRDWEMRNPRQPNVQPHFSLRFIPLREVIYCKVVGIDRYSVEPEEWTTQWEIGLRDTRPIRLPQGRQADPEAASALGRAIADRIGLS